MSEKKLNLDTPLITHISQFIAFIILAVIVFFLGLIISIYFSDFTHLGRSGAIITLIAISMAYQDFHLDIKNMKFEDAIKTFSNDSLFELWSKSFVSKNKAELDAIKPGYDAADALEFLDQLCNLTEDKINNDDFIKAWLKQMFNSWSKTLRNIEFKILIIGTILWAFSDLINNLFGW
jgi:hypothetical protein